MRNSDHSSKRIHLTPKLERESIVAILGIASEYYNIFLYGYLSYLIIPHFFLISSPIKVTYLVLASYVMGPLGAIICGHIGDTLGRKKILSWTIACVALPSFLISILPTYDQIGFLASLLFIFIRSIQTLAFGGDMIGLVTFILEDIPKSHRGLFGGYMSMGAGIGVGLASLLIFFIDPYGDPLSSWKWRLLLCIGILGMLLAVYFYHAIGETETFRHYKAKYYIKTIPLVDLLRNNKTIFLNIIGITALAPIITITIFGYIPYLSINHLKISSRLSMEINSLGLLLFSIGAPLFGFLSDKIGRKPVLFSVSGFFLIAGFPLFYILDLIPIRGFLIIQLIISFISSAYYGVAMTACIEHLPTHIRYTGVALGYYITYALFGGINGNYIEKWLINSFLFKTDIAPVFYLLLGSIIVLFSTYFLKEKNLYQLPNK